MAKKIVVWGTSLKKVADEAQLIAHFTVIKSILPDSEVTILTYPRQDILRQYPGLTVIPTIRLFQSLSVIAKSDLFVIGGGPFFEEFSQLVKIAILLLWAKLNCKPLLLFGITIFPLKTWWGPAAYRFLIGLADEIVVRDRVSFQTLKESGLRKDFRQGTDPRVLQSPASHGRVSEILRAEGLDPAQPLIGITTRYMHTDVPEWVRRAHGIDGERVERSNAVMAETVAHLSRKGQVFLIPMSPDHGEDEQTAAIIRGHMPDGAQLKVLHGRYLASEVIGIIQACEMMLAGRLGSALFCGITATPLVAIAYEARMIDQMKDLGLEQYVFDWKSLDHESMIRAVDDLRGRREEIVRSMQSRGESLREHARADAEIYRKFLIG
jgi:polysaccharide pyruvyl transferase WcaK-like protein